MLGKSKVKYIQSLGQKKHRDQEGLFIAEGPKIVEELLDAGSGSVSAVYALASWVDAHRGRYDESLLTVVDEPDLAKISQLHTPNQVLAIVQQYRYPPVPLRRDNFVLALDAIQDPGNLGTIIRIADWFGIGAIVCSRESADHYNPKVVQSTMGSIARIPVYYEDLAEWLGGQTGSRIFAAHLNGQDITTMARPPGGIIVIGNESKGISDAVLEKVNVRITIPRKGKAESLNAAVAAGIIAARFVS